MMYKIYDYSYIPGSSYTKSGFKGRGLAVGTVINEDTGAFVVAGGNGTYVIAIPAKIIIRAASESRDIKSLEIGPLLRQCIHALHRRLTSDLAKEICENLIGKEFNDENEINDIEKLICDIIPNI
ncbi:hypothetical protein IKT64_03155 [Candidatus Saccharibacteria bacterium]|nr:hypothetical protein [Candidatus Saccharibacteria bacterium]